MASAERGVRPVLPRAIVQLGRALRLEVTAEGIETLAQEAVLRRLGCTRGQGYLYAQPLPASEMDPLLEVGFVRTREVVEHGAKPIPIRRAARTSRTSRGAA